MRSIYISLFLLISGAVWGQLPYQLGGARSAGLGNASVAAFDAWAFQQNIGALAGVQEAGLHTGYQTRLNLAELSTAGIMLIWPLRLGVAGAGVTRYGFGAYHLTEGSLGFAHRIGLVSLGVRAGFVQEATDGFGSQSAPLLSLGGTAQLLPSLRFGAYGYNLTQSRLNREQGEYLPTLLKAGILWQAGKPIQLSLETEKDVDHPASFKAGLAYQLKDFLELRTGISTAPVSLHGGFGLSPGLFRFDYALQHHQYLGIMHQLSAGWIFKKKP